MVEAVPQEPAFPGKEMLNERFSWLLKYGKTHEMRLLAQAAAAANYTDAIEFLKANPAKLSDVALLFRLPSQILFSSNYINESEFMSYCED